VVACFKQAYFLLRWQLGRRLENLLNPAFKLHIIEHCVNIKYCRNVAKLKRPQCFQIIGWLNFEIHRMEIGKKLARSLLLLVGWIHALITPIGEWFSVSVLGAFEELTKVILSRSTSSLLSLI